MKIYDIKSLKNSLISKVSASVGSLSASPQLSILLGKKDDDALYYADSLVKKGQKFGFQVSIHNYTDRSEFRSLISDAKITKGGIIAMAPYTDDIEDEDIQDIPPECDVDCINKKNWGDLFLGHSDFAPATASAVFEIAKDHFGSLSGINAVIIGRSQRVGKPLIPLLLKENATVTICHSKTRDLADIIRSADIVICSIGRARFFRDIHFKNSQFIIDVGINKTECGFCGDVDAENICDLDVTVTPVPGGVGTITTLMIFINLLELYKKRN